MKVDKEVAEKNLYTGTYRQKLLLQTNSFHQGQFDNHVTNKQRKANDVC